jgi:hypothetical protein
MTCYLSYCYGSSDPNCITTNCGGQIQACVNGAARDGGVGVGDAGVPSAGDGGALLTCSELLPCLQACATQTCADACIAQGTPTARVLGQALTSCYITHCTGSSDPYCVVTHCPSELQACQNDHP